jgi:DNA repair protein RecO
MSTQSTNYIILRKTPYHETSLILGGITREHGRVDLLVKGAKKIGSKSLPAIDLFREINVNINLNKDGLQAIYSAELVSNFDNIALKKEAYLDACEISKFVLRNSQPANPSPETYNALKTAFQLLSEGNDLYCSPLVKLIYLSEHGLLPELPEERKKESELLAQLIEVAKGKNKLPNISKEYMDDINSWIDSICKFNEL